jgi:hypothetical protein
MLQLILIVMATVATSAIEKHGETVQIQKLKPTGFDEEGLPSVAICSKMYGLAEKDRPYFEEWVRYHRFVGVDTFYVHPFDDSSLPAAYLRSDVFQGKVISRKWWRTAAKNINTTVSPQNLAQALSLCVRQHAHLHDFIAVIDKDEFMYVDSYRSKKNSLQSFLVDYLHVGGLFLHWRRFGSSGLISPPKTKSYLRNFVKCCKNETLLNSELAKSPTKQNSDGFSKSIVNTKFVEPSSAICGCHRCSLSNKGQLHNSELSTTSTVTFHNAWINHYMLPSRQEFFHPDVAKLKDNNKFHSSLQNKQHMAMRWNKTDEIAVEDCEEMLEIVELL